MLKIFSIVFCVLALFSTSISSEEATMPPAQGKVTALLIIDIQDFYFPGGHMPLLEPEAAGRNAARILEKFRAESRPVIHVGHKAKDKTGFHETVAPKSGEKVIMKSEVSSFNGTDLLPYLRELNVQRLVILGMQTHMCVEAAVRAAHDLGFECILVGDACATRSLKYKDREVSAQDVHDSTLSTLDRTYAAVVDTETFLAEY